LWDILINRDKDPFIPKGGDEKILGYEFPYLWQLEH
jgi:hypothetical protein